MESRETLEIRSADTNRRMQWMFILAKDPEVAQLAFELSELDSEEKKLMIKIMNNIIDSVQLYSISKEKTIRRSISSTITNTTSKIADDNIMDVFSV